MTETIEMPFGLWAWVGPKKHVLDGGALKPRLHDTTWCQTGLTTDWMYTRYNQLSNGLSNRLSNLFDN